MQRPEAGLDPAVLRLVEIELPARLGAALAAGLSRALALPCRLEAWRPAPAPLLAGRDQWDAGALLSGLAARSASPDEWVLGFTLQDVGLPVFSFVFGLAQERGRAALVSLARLDPRFYGLPADAARTLERALAEARHELGHLAGRPHCESATCLMRFAVTLERADARGTAFCEACRARLPAWLAGRRP